MQAKTPLDSVDPRRALTTRCLKITQQESQEDRISRQLSILQNNEEITDANKEAVEEFVDSLKAAKKPRLSKTLQYITNMMKLLTEYCEAEDLRELDMKAAPWEEWRLTAVFQKTTRMTSVSPSTNSSAQCTSLKERPNRVRRFLNSDTTKLQAPPESQRNRAPFRAEENVAMH